MEDLKKISPEHERMVETSENVNKLMQQIVRERIKQGLSQRDLAEMTGLNQSAIARFETLETTPTIITLIKITNALNLSVNALGKEKEHLNSLANKPKRDKERIKPFLQELEKYWLKNYDQRFGQLVYNLSRINGLDLFNTEDNEWFKVITESKNKELSDSNSRFYKENAEMKQQLQNAIVPRYRINDKLFCVNAGSVHPCKIKAYVSSDVYYVKIGSNHRTIKEDKIFATKEQARLNK